MNVSKLMIKQKDKLLVQKIGNNISPIIVPTFSNKYTNIYNIALFIDLLVLNELDDSFNLKRPINYFELLDYNYTIFDQDSLTEIDENTYLYDIGDRKLDEKCFPSSLTWIDSAINKNTEISHVENGTLFKTSELFYSKEIKDTLKIINNSSTKEKVLLLYSGGKDSTLSAIRLHNLGYQVDFIHFDNGYMKDVDKPFLTYKKTFFEIEGYDFLYINKAINIKQEFDSLLFALKSQEKQSLKSEMTCLCCRSTMYKYALDYALKNNYKYIAEGARICQDFMIEQPEMLHKYEEILKQHGIPLLLPVLNITDDDELKKELLANGNSSKGWESKCLIGEKPVSKTESDKAKILNYFDKSIKSKVFL